MTYAQTVRRGLVKRSLSIRELADNVGISYEHCRRIVTGEPVVSESLNSRLSQVLGLNEAEMWRLALQEKASERFGARLGPEGLDSQGQKLILLWRRLQKPERSVLLTVAEGLYARERLEARRAQSGIGRVKTHDG